MLQLNKYEIVQILLTFVGVGVAILMICRIVYTIAHKPVPHTGMHVTIKTIEYDGCEYLEYSPNRGSSYRCLTHKGNCKRCAERNGK